VVPAPFDQVDEDEAHQYYFIHFKVELWSSAGIGMARRRPDIGFLLNCLSGCCPFRLHLAHEALTVKRRTELSPVVTVADIASAMATCAI
jgi:hypothetical protein